MRRLVYSPKVECLIMREDARELIDVTPDIVNGVINRRLNAVSDMQLTLQNKYGRYTQQNTISPMDRIIVRMSRVGAPFLVFSGFVDDAPFYQLYPGTVTLAASCTLKLLQHTMFDPGVLFIHNWFIQHGWQYNPDDGSLFLGPPGVGNNDLYGTVGDIITALLTEVGNWPEEAVTIYDLPSDFLKNIAKVMQDASNTGVEIYEQNAQILARLYGTADIVPSGSSSLEGDTSSLPSTGNIDIVDVARLALKAGFAGDNAITAVAVARAESSFATQAMNWNPDTGTGQSGDGTWDVGLWQINSQHASPPANHLPGSPASSLAGYNSVKNLYTSTAVSYIESLWNPTTNAAAAYSISSNGTTFTPWATYNNNLHKPYMTAAADAVTKAQLAPNSPISISSTGTTTTSTTTSSAGNDSPQRQDATKWTMLDGTTPMVTGGTSPYSNLRFDSQVDWVHVIPYLLKTVDTICRQNNVTADVNSGYRDNNYSAAHGGFAGDPHSKGVAIDAYVNGQPICTSTIPASDFTDAGIRLGSSFVFSGSPDNEHLDMMDASGTSLNTTAQKWLASGGSGTYSGTTTIGNQNVGTFTKQQIMQLGGAAAFFTQQMQNSDFVLSEILTGRRALANDISLMEWIDNLVPSAGRVYTSTPSGNFLSFFPDRWGFFARTPYFYITDTEIVDLTININDSNLATHVFTTGPEVPTNGIQYYDRITSMVASVEEDAFQYFVSPPKGFSPVQFLAKYGARPYVNDIMNINNPLLLWMNGWMKFMELWAKRYTATASITFMPEIFPGGRISLGAPGNRVEMFVESVSHTFDLSGGFSTSAELSSIVSVDNDFPGLVDPSQGFGPQVQQQQQVVSKNAQ